eukprot:461143_1
MSDDNTILMEIRFEDSTCFLQFTRNDDFHSMNCSDPLLIPSDMTPKPIHDNNYTISMYSNDVVLSEQSNIHHMSRTIQRLAVNLSKFVYLGEALHLNVSVMDDIITQSTSKLFVSSNDLNIDVIIDIQYTNNAQDTCEIESVSTGTSRLCTDGILFHRLKSSMIGSRYEILFHSEDTYLTQDTMQIEIEQCDIGYGLLLTPNDDNIDINVPCTPCAPNTINLYPNSRCADCSDVDGIECLGSSDLKIDFNYWMNFDIQSNAFISSYCPSGYCCLQQNGCFYDNASVGLCALNRNASIPLCGGCNDGFVEVFGNTNCMKCADNHYEYLLLPIFLALLYVIALAHLNTDSKDPNKNKKEINYTVIFVKDDLEAIKIALLRPLTYLFQCIAVITIQTGYAFYLQPVLELFSMQFVFINTTDDDGSSGICFTTHLNAIAKEIWYLFHPFAMFVIIFIYYVTYDKLKLFEWTKRKPNFAAAFWQTLLICMGAILSKMFKILACRTLDTDVTVHFYAGNVECYGYEWMACAISLLIIVMVWCGIWYYLYGLEPLKRASSKAMTKNITHSYRKECWYWEFVFLTRRILLALIITFNYLNESFTQYTLLTILIIYLVIHLKYQPFKHGRVNYFETICIMLLIFGLTALG